MFLATKKDMQRDEEDNRKIEHRWTGLIMEGTRKTKTDRDRQTINRPSGVDGQGEQSIRAERGGAN